MKRLGLRTMLAAVGLLGLAATPSSSQQELKFMTGPQGGFWVPLGGALKDLWEKNVKGVSVQALPGAGIANVRGIEEGKADIGFGNTISTVDALAGAAPFGKPHKNVCHVATMYPQYMQVIVLANSGINTVADAKGRTLTTLPRGNTTEYAANHILKVHGLTYNDMKVNFVSTTDAVTQMQDGHANLWIIGTGIPAGGIMDLAAGRDVKLLGIEDKIGELKKLNPGYQLYSIPANTYPKQDKPVQVAGFGSHLVVSCKLPEDVVYQMTKSMSENKSTLAAVGKAMEEMTPQVMAQDVGLPFHPGAAKFYKEKGITVK